MDKLVNVLFFKSAWVWGILFMGFLAFHHAGNKKLQEIALLEKKQAQLEQEKQACLEVQEDLRLCIASRSDPAWIELMLMKNLGVVPEGQIKVHFTSEE